MTKFKDSCDICKELLCDFKRRDVEVFLKGVKEIRIDGLTLSEGSVSGKLVDVDKNFVVLADVVSIPGVLSINAVLCCDDICAVEADRLLPMNGPAPVEA